MNRLTSLAAAALLVAATLAGCALPKSSASSLLPSSASSSPAQTQAPGGQRPVTVVRVQAVTADNRLIAFEARAPGTVLSDKPLTGLQAGETLLGIDYRVAKGQLYGVGSSGRLYRIDADSAAVTAIGAPLPFPLVGDDFGIDFNPTVDRLRVVSSGGLNLRLHPDTGAAVDGNADLPGLQFDGPLQYEAGDVNANRAPRIVAAAYTYNKENEKITTNYAIDANFGTLVMQGSREGTTPAVSPNTGRLTTVGRLGVAPFQRAAFDISDLSNAAYAALTGRGASASRWVEIDLQTGAARELGPIGGGVPVRGIAIEP